MYGIISPYSIAALRISALSICTVGIFKTFDSFDSLLAANIFSSLVAAECDVSCVVRTVSSCTTKDVFIFSSTRSFPFSPLTSSVLSFQYSRSLF